MTTPLHEQPSTSKSATRNLKRKISYQQMPPDKKAALLHQRQATYFARTHPDFPPAAFPSSDMLPLFPSMINTSESSVTSYHEALNQCPTIYEKGSTSAAAPNEHSSFCQAQLAIEDCHPGQMGCWNINSLPSTPALLKQVPNCKYCTARRFQYEPPGFCCSNGAVKLASHDLPPMLKNLYFDDITPKSPKWTCKVQIIDICGPAESKEKGIMFFNMLLQDELEDQVKAIVYGEDIPPYERRMKLYRTYYITGACMQVPYLKTERPVHTFNWVLDRRNVIDKVKKHDVDALPLPTKLDTTSFENIKHHAFQTVDMGINEFDILAIVVNCAPPRYVPTVDKRIQELILMTMSKETLTFTIWEERIIEQEGSKLLQQLHQYPVILARRIGASKYNGVSLTTKFNTTIQINPPYPQCCQLQKWTAENQQMLASFTPRSTSTSGLLISIPVEEEVVPIASIESQQDGQTFCIEAKISCPTDLRSLYVLVCSNCGQDVRYPTIREIHCMNCDKKSTLLPRCRFEIHLEDNSGSTIGMIMDKEAEKLLSLTAQEIYQKASYLDKDADMEEIQRNFNDKFFSIRAKKAFARTSRTAAIKVYIQSCVEKQSFTPSLPSSSIVTIQEGTKRKQQVEPAELPEQTASLKIKQKVCPDTPPKNK